MDQLKAMKVFQRVAERGSLTAASLDLGLSRGGASAVVTELEKYLGVQLIERTTRSLRLTEDGLYYLEKARAITEAVANLEDEVGSAERQPRGRLRVQIPAGLAALAVAPALPEFLAAYPQVDLEILSRDGVPDFVGDQIDAAVLVGTLPALDIVARPLGRIPLMTVASPHYLASHGAPASAEELSRHQCIPIISSVSGRAVPWRFRVDEALGRDLMSFGTPILVLGDPGQLPPISGGGFFTEHEPDILLTEIHRQARDNPIIDLAMQVREGREIMHGDYGTAQVIGKNEVDRDMVLEADQVLVGINRTRRRYNQRLRELKGFDQTYPQAGDKLVCLRNDPAKGLLNGSLWQVMTSSKETVKPGINLLVRPEDDDMDRGSAKIKLLKSAFDDPDLEVPWQTKKRYDDFDYGYALTVHKAQGSQWNSVVLFDESFAFRDSRERWLYTAITRAAERLVIVR